MRVFAPAKINLFLHIGDQRADGYHELESLVAFADVGDDLDFEHADALSLTVDGPFAAALAGGDDNLILRAAHGTAMLAGHDIPRRIALTKNLPVASGIGGGSSDAAATLRAFLLEWPGENVKLSDFVELAKTLGADVPVCFFGHSAWMYGIGDGIERTDLPELHAVLVNPGVAVATRDVFAALHDKSGTDIIDWPQDFRDADAVIHFLSIMRNDLEAPALKIAPAIGDALAALRAAPGIQLARMSGSGATCFGLFADQASAQSAAQTISNTHPDWWVRATVLAKADEEAS
ncbi:MAG TPA: 4-(cytidine 5'-diphospho)-2-C-methyl-D-erythritol kinase [Rhizomicrobium sp.]